MPLQRSQVLSEDSPDLASAASFEEPKSRKEPKKEVHESLNMDLPELSDAVHTFQPHLSIIPDL
jgi:hypothetical protein